MKVIRWNRLRATVKPIPATLVVGVFDAFHRGHQTLADAAFAEAGDRTRVAVTFRRMPPGKGKPVYPFRMRLDDLKAAGFDEAVVIDFNKRFAALSAIDFFQRLGTRYRLETLTVGADFRCGSNRSTSVTELQRLLPQTTVQAVEPAGDNTGKVSASNIRRFLQAGDAEAANALLQRPYRLPLRCLKFGQLFFRQRRGLTQLADGVYKATVNGEDISLILNDAYVHFNRKLLVKKPIEIIILSREKE